MVTRCVKHTQAMCALSTVMARVLPRVMHRPCMPCLQAGAFRIGDTAGTLENIVACKLYRPGSVGFVSKSGGMSNEMYNVLSRATNGLYEGAPALPDACV